MLESLPPLAEMLSHLREAAPVILGLIVIEGLLSVDNALAIAAMARHLDEKQRKFAMNIGYAGAYIFRVLALIVAAWIIKHEWVKALGALYLVWLMCQHFTAHEVDADHDGKADGVVKRTLGATVMMIALMDLSLSVDNVVAAIALSPKEMWPVYVGVTIGIISLRLIAGVAVKLIERFPILEHAAFVLIGYVGLVLAIEIGWHHFTGHELHIDKKDKFIGIVAIIALSIVYSQKAWMRAVLAPLFAAARPLMKLFVMIWNVVWLPLSWPYHKITGA